MKYICKQCGKEFEDKPSRKRKYCSHSCQLSYRNKTVKMSSDTKDKIRNTLKDNIPWNRGKKCPQISKGLTGRKLSKEHIEKISEIGKTRTGSKNSCWRGGLTPLNSMIRESDKNKAWIHDILKRDGFTCQNCRQVGGTLHVHHIKYFSTIVKEYNIQSLQEAFLCEELWLRENGVTLCKKCHKQSHK